MSTKLSPISVVQQLHRQDLFYFTPRLLSDLLALDVPHAYYLLARLKESGLIAEVENGKYLVLGFEPERVLANPLFIASHLVAPAYVSYWSALHHYGFTEQAPLTVFAATTKKKRPVDFGGFRFRYVTIQPHKFFGYRREDAGGLPVLIADEAKSIVDSLDQSRYAGGIAEVAKALQAALPTLDVPTLMEYANRMADKSLGSRLGYLFDLLGQSEMAAGLIRSVSPVKLDPTRPGRGRHVPAWQVIVNVPEADLFPSGVG
jgi:predicted transcriptional regulator of viral defense system